MARNDDIRFVSSSIKIPTSPKCRPFPTFSPLPFARHDISSHLLKAQDSIRRLLSSLPKRGWGRPNVLLCSSSLALTRPEQEQSLRRPPHGKEDEERVLISEVLIRNKDGEVLERTDLEVAASGALRFSRPNSALTVREVQEDVHRIIDSGLFCSCMPIAVDTRDGIRLVFQVEPNQEFHGLICEGANVLPTKFVEDAFRDGYGQIVNIRHLDKVIKSINGWYIERGLFGAVSDVEILSGGILKLQVSEAEVNNINIRFLDRKTGEPTEGRTKIETILRQLTTKKGQVYSLLQGRRDVETILTMGLMEDVTIIPQPSPDGQKVDLVMNLVERPSGGFSAGGGISSGITNGPLSGLIGSFAYSHRNVFGRNQKLNLSLERGQIDSIFRMNYSDPWIEGDDKRTSRTIMIQNSRTPGTLVHGGQQSGHSGLTIGRVTAGIEYSRPIRPQWSGTVGVIFQIVVSLGLDVKDEVSEGGSVEDGCGFLEEESFKYRVLCMHTWLVRWRWVEARAGYLYSTLPTHHRIAREDEFFLSLFTVSFLAVKMVTSMDHLSLCPWIPRGTSLHGKGRVYHRPQVL